MVFPRCPSSFQNGVEGMGHWVESAEWVVEGLGLAHVVVGLVVEEVGQEVVGWGFLRWRTLLDLHRHCYLHLALSLENLILPVTLQNFQQN